ncbi:TIR domain-containing protein [Streptomyces sp. NPDC013433]|uniref:TIR domain-containing protein n=1 Tax=Streptomyces sp. NPDC013433 TaxID=3155604 RepID=UPI00345611C7
MAPSVFINFRRADTGGAAPHLDTGLRGRFGEAEVFRDQRSIDKGAHYPDQIKRKLRKCELLLALIGKKWETAVDEDHRRCLDDETDWVRMEIALALQWGLTVLPVLVDREEMPDRADIPDDIRALASRQAIHFRPHHEEIYLPPLIKAVRAAVPELGARRRRDDAGGGGNVGDVRSIRSRNGVVLLGGSGQGVVHNYSSDHDDDFEDDFDEDLDDDFDDDQDKERS